MSTSGAVEAQNADVSEKIGNDSPRDTLTENMDTSEGNGDVWGEATNNEETTPAEEEVVASNGKKPAFLSPSRKSKRISTRRKSRPIPKYLRDAITVNVPLNVTADLKIAIQRTRAKRINSLYKLHPALKKATKKSSQGDNSSKADDPLDEDEALKKDPTEGKENNKPGKKKKKVLEHVPQPEQYGSVLDYLEAKYVRGVMLGDEEADGASVGDGSEGAGSIYSGGSFLDDTDLQRDVAEQVMANTTLTKLELEDEDGDFFVNVGNLEVEDNLYGEDYDPAHDKEAAKVPKKRKKPQGGGAESEGKKKKGSEGDSLAQSSKSKKSISSKGSKKRDGAAEDKKATDSDEKNSREKAAKNKVDKLMKNIATSIKAMTKENLPRRKKNLTVSLTCPMNKKPGDLITFANPLNNEQKLRAKVPKNAVPGGTFRASVPLPKDQIEETADADANKFPRDFQELAVDFATAYDEWSSARAEVDKTVSVLHERRAKWDKVIKLFPKDLLAPIDTEYMMKLVRRARQNRKKRQKKAEGGSSALASSAGSQKTVASGKHPKTADHEKQQDHEENVGRIVLLPSLGSIFPTVAYRHEDFDTHTQGTTSP